MAGATAARLVAVAEQRWGLVTTEQAAAVGVSPNTLTRMTASGALTRVAQGVYRMTGAPELEHEDIYAKELRAAISDAHKISKAGTKLRAVLSAYAHRVRNQGQ